MPSTDGRRRIVNVSRPTLTVHQPQQANGTAVVICPGGGFRQLSIDHEGHEVAKFLNRLGVTAFVLKYRVYRTSEGETASAAMLAERRAGVIPLSVADGREAVRLVRARAKEWSLRPDRIGIMGFSAGGYVTAALALVHDEASRPDFAIPVYGALPPDAKAPARPMPLFLLHADDDPTVKPELTSIRLYSMWKQVQAPAELHIYAKGGHGFGIRKTNHAVDSWPERLREWMSAQGLLP
jgi:acetyl esterase/lipase